MVFEVDNKIIGSEIVERKGLVQGYANVGVGLFTSICLGFANVFGCECKCYENKIEKAVKIAQNKLMKQAKEKNANAIVSYSVKYNFLSVYCYGVAVVTEKISKDNNE